MTEELFTAMCISLTYQISERSSLKRVSRLVSIQGQDFFSGGQNLQRVTSEEIRQQSTAPWITKNRGVYA